VPPFVKYTPQKIPSGDQIRRTKWVGHVAQMGKRGSVHRVLVGTPDGQRPFGRPRSRREYNIKMDFQKLAWRGMVWIGLA
jgi:hypothetical protein